MPFITFIYRIEGNKRVFYGKYVCDYISDDHDGLDSEIYPTLIDGINMYRSQKGIPKLSKKVVIGILSFSSNRYIPTYSTDNEIKCFDFYHIKHILKKDETYINGNLIN